MSQPKVPFDRTKTWPLAAAIILNLIPVAGVLFWGWSAFALIFLYWMENLVIGARTLLSMLANALVTSGANWPGTLFFMLFFTVHYGMFCFGHGTFIMALFGNGAYGESIIDLPGALRTVFATQTNLYLGLASIVVWQIIQFVLFLARGEAKRTSPSALMGAPYPRIMILQVTIIFGGFVLMLLNQPAGGILILALVKMAYDVADVLRDPKADDEEESVSAAEPAPPR